MLLISASSYLRGLRAVRGLAAPSRSASSLPLESMAGSGWSSSK